ncbi:50S ribosomal protein L3 N(5)-glutamine methyltransferase [Psychrosphaera aestuarii]|uniref:50S ribosomal protein L3 N(5)-glutamine methyltransferase n=1 Tax=Psychrosphaera aestuarii TaxID=1266052 RepID=UPI001B33287B|nr:50S ribosomal protein L3 N(5)-glutamine methyltransferase [Psychrosphaera aestuarii]
MSEQPTLSLLAQEAIEELLTANDILRWAVSRFNESDVYYGHGTDNPWDEAFSLLAWGLNIGPMLNSEVLSSRLTISERKRIIDVIVARIESKKPAAYLTNQAYFVDLPFYVDENVLVPRSPIGELIKEQFKSVIDFTPNSILDLCTGSGCIAVACAYAFEEAYVDAADISPDALAIADENIHRLGVSDRVVPLLSDVFSGLGGQRYDLIVSNPPYVDAEDIGDMPEEFHHEPEIGLGSGPDGLDLTRIILKEASQYLTEQGVLIVEVGNSMIHLVELLPTVPFNWIEFKNGGLGVFSITKSQLDEYQEVINSTL